MDRSLSPTLANLADLEGAAQVLLGKASAIVARSGAGPASMAEIGELIRAMADSGVLGPLIEDRAESETARIKLLGRASDGSMLSFYAMDGWVSPPSAEVHWHNYWQSMLIVSGTWHDSIWKPVGNVQDGVASDVVLDRREILSGGEVQILGPNEPHGWDAAERRKADGVVQVMWSGSTNGKPRVDLDIETGRISENFGFLNPAPEDIAARQ